MADAQYSPHRQPIPPDAVLCAQTLPEHRLHLPGPVLDLALYRLPDDSYLVEWFWVQDQETPPTAYRHEVAECETFLVALHRLATFDIAAWDTRAEALTQYDWDVQVLLEDFFAQP